MRKSNWLKTLIICTLLISVMPVGGTVSAEGYDYDYVGDFSEGLAAVVKDWKYGYVNQEGKNIIPLIYDAYIDEDEGEWLGGTFYDGVAGAYKNGKYGFIDKQGKTVVPFIYDDIGQFGNNKLTWASKEHTKYGFINRKGEVVIPFIYDFAQNFYEDRALVIKDGKQGYINLDGTEVGKLKYDAHPGDWLDDYRYQDGMAKVLQDFKAGYIDLQGNLEIPIKYEIGSNGFSEGYAAVTEDDSTLGKFGYIDRTGQVKIPFRYDAAWYFQEGLARVGLGSYENIKYGYINKEGKEVVPIKYDETWYFYDGMAWVGQGKRPNPVKYGYVNKQGEEIIPLIYDTASNFYEGLALVGKGDSYKQKYGFVNKQGKEVVPLIYEAATRFSEGLAWVKQHGKWYIIDKTGTIVAGQAKAVYQYDELDAGTTVDLDYEQLNNIITIEDAVRVVEGTAQTLTFEQKMSATGIDRMTLFAEEAASRVNVQSLYQNEVLLTAEMINELSMTAANARYAIEQVLREQGIERQRELRVIIRLNVNAGGEPLAIKVDPAVGLITGEPIQIAAGSAVVTINAATVSGELDRSNPLTIKLEEVTANPTSNTANVVHKVTFNKSNFQEIIKLSLPPASGDLTYQTVMTADSKPVTSKYNPATGLMMANITSSGTYTVKQNIKDFSDTQNKPKEMQEAIRYLASKGIINGTSDTKFSPDGSISRAEIAALVVRALGKLDANADGGFKDVTRSNWYYGAVGSAKRFGIINGYEDNTFKGNVTIPKVQIVAIAARTLEKEMGYNKPSNISSYLTYADSSGIAEWAKADIAMATRESLVVKQTGNRFTPNDNMTRGDAAIILKRMFDRIW